MLRNDARKESMKEDYCKLGSEHDKGDPKQSKLDYQPTKEL